MNYLEQSEKITEGLRKSFQSTDAKIANRVCYGYTSQPDGELAINEKEAAVVQWIFERYLAGDNFGKIATGLQKTMSLYGTQFKNDGELAQVLIKNHHDAIISAEDFQSVQEMKVDRSKVQTQEIGMTMSY